MTLGWWEVVPLYCLKTIRFQKRRAQTIMRLVNEAFELPNPPSRFERALKCIKESVTGAVKTLRRIAVPQQQDLSRVSHGVKTTPCEPRTLTF